LARKILLADDSVTAQNMGRKILTDAGYDVITVNNGSAALKRVTEQKPDLVVLDVYMPGYSGLEVCARLKDSPDTARIPILLTVGKLEPFKPEEATRVRADGFIVKPFEASELLSALTRLEDRMVPAQTEGARFSNSVSGIERFSGGDPAVNKSEGGDDSDTGWKNRLRFPSKKKKEPEPEPEADFVTPPSFRDYRRGGGKAPAASGTFPVNAASAAGQEPGLVPDIPRDITPEELDALSALVAKLDGPIQAENVTALGEKIGAVATPAAVGKTAEAAEAPAAAKIETEAVSAPAETEKKIDATAAEVASQPAASSTSAPEVEPPSTSEPVVAAVETAPVEAVAAEVVPAEPGPVPVAPEPSPAERTDEPIFASAASATTPISEETKPEAQETKAAAENEASAPVEAAKVEAAAPLEESKVQEPPKSEEAAPAAMVAASVPPAAEPEVPAPSAEELAEALRLLTPSHTPGAPQTLAEAGAALVEELARGSAGGGRWVAEAVALSPEEASASLEEEMFRTFAAAPSNGDAPAGAATSASATVGHDEEEAAEAAVEGAEAAEAGAESTSAVVAAESVAGVTSAPAKIEEARGEEVAAATFADAMRSEEAQSVSAKEKAEPVAASSAAQEEVSNSEDEPGGQEAMGKETKGKGGKSNWHQIRSGAPAAAASDVVEAAKQAEDAPKTMAAAASGDGTDASAIASIVDSVLADLRPKIVEEIAKKLAKK
jgi:CheY-like chemotaxis protein